MKFTSLFAATAVSVALMGSAAHAVTNDFNEITDTAGYAPDRYAPEGFTAGVNFDGRQVLEQTIGTSGSTANRPAAYSSTFYNTQGMQTTNFDAGTTSMSIQLYVTDGWATTGNRMAGFWGIAENDGVAPPSFYPIIEYSSDSLFGAGFRGWNDASGWINLGNSNTNYNGWNTLTIALNGANWDYSVNGQVRGSVNAGGSTYLEKGILQGHNTSSTPYAIRWDNLSTPGAVPEPSTWALMIMGFGSAGAMIRSRRMTSVTA